MWTDLKAPSLADMEVMAHEMFERLPEHFRTMSGHIVRHVLIHEIGHHFGMSDDDMAAIEASVD